MWQLSLNPACMAARSLYRVTCVSYKLPLDHMQKDIAMPLDLSAFACGQIQVSFAVVTQQERSEFSPTHSLCVDGGT